MRGPGGAFQHPHASYCSHPHVPTIRTVGGEKCVLWPMYTAGTMVSINSWSSNSIAKCYFLEHHREWCFIFASCTVRDPSSFPPQTESDSSGQMGFKPSLLLSEFPKGCSCHRDLPPPGSPQEARSEHITSNCTEQNPTAWRSEPDLNALVATLTFSSHLSASEKRFKETDSRIYCLFLSNSVLHVDLPSKW